MPYQKFNVYLFDCDVKQNGATVMTLQGLVAAIQRLSSPILRVRDNNGVRWSIDCTINSISVVPSYVHFNDTLEMDLGCFSDADLIAVAMQSRGSHLEFEIGEKGMPTGFLFDCDTASCRSKLGGDYNLEGSDAWASHHTSMYDYKVEIVAKAQAPTPTPQATSSSWGGFTVKQDPPVARRLPKDPQHCRHEPVNIGFGPVIKMACKHCGVDLAEDYKPRQKFPWDDDGEW